MACYTTPLEKAMKTREMPLSILSSIPFESVDFKNRMGLWMVGGKNVYSLVKVQEMHNLRKTNILLTIGTVLA